MAAILVIGAGRVGRAIALDLGQHHPVTVADIHAERLFALHTETPALAAVHIPSQAPQTLQRLAQQHDLLITAVPGYVGFSLLMHLIETGKPIVDISFFPEDPFSLQEKAQQYGSTVIVDAGIAPGLCNLLLGRCLSEMEVESYECWVGGLPLERRWPWQYKAPFSPTDVIEEYTRPVRQRIAGQLVTKPPLSEIEYRYFPGIGTLEAFNTDGLRTLLHTTTVPTLIEKTLRYPGHAEYVRVLAETGFFSEEPLQVEGLTLRPRALTEALLARVWHLPPDEPDCVLLWVRIKGKKDGKPTEKTFYLYDQADLKHHISAMARTTGYTCTAIAALLLGGVSLPPGIYAPELLGQNPAYAASVLEYLAHRGITVQEGP